MVHVVSSSKFAQKAEDAGCDAVMAEGFEAGGHNGREETTSMVREKQAVFLCCTISCDGVIVFCLVHLDAASYQLSDCVC